MALSRSLIRLSSRVCHLRITPIRPVTTMNLEEIAIGRPFLTRDQVLRLVEEHYDFHVAKLTALDAYDNQNFKIEVSSTNRREVIKKHGTTYTLKVTNSCISKSCGTLIPSTEVMQFLNKQDFRCPCPTPIQTVDGQYGKLLSFQQMNLSENGEPAVNPRAKDTFLVRLLTYLPGSTLNDLTFVPDNIFEEWGETLAKMHLSFKEIKIDAKPFQDWSQTFAWSMDLLTIFRGSLHYIDDPSRQTLAREIIDAFENKVLPRKQELPHGFLHSDFNDVNLLVTKQLDGSESDSKIHLTGMIDFDDMTHSCVVYDVGISLMYVLQSKSSTKHDAAALFLTGYNKYRELSPVERDCLFYCTAARFTQSLIGGLYNYSVIKEDYVLLTQQRGWEAIEEIWKQGKDQMYKRWQLK